MKTATQCPSYLVSVITPGGDVFDISDYVLYERVEAGDYLDVDIKTRYNQRGAIKGEPKVVGYYL